MPKQWKSQLLSKYPNLIHGSVLERPGEELGRCYFLKQEHTDIIVKVDRSTLNDKALGPADGLITDKLSCVLVLKTADCVPVLIYDPVHNVVGAVHAGWQGTVKRIVLKLIERMGEEWGSRPTDILVAMGPSIRACHYDISLVEDNRAERFAELFPDIGKVLIRQGDKIALDNAEANRQLCLQIGIQPSNIDISPICVFEDKEWPSYRRDGEDYDVFFTFIGLK